MSSLVIRRMMYAVNTNDVLVTCIVARGPILYPFFDLYILFWTLVEQLCTIIYLENSTDL